jgi:hypothetical protein
MKVKNFHTSLLCTGNFLLFLISHVRTWTNTQSVHTHNSIKYFLHRLRTAISKILYGQYHIWDLFGLSQTRSVRMGADTSDESTPNTPKFIRPICPIAPKVWDIVEISLHWASVVRDFIRR